jgi:hypothetical protein
MMSTQKFFVGDTIRIYDNKSRTDSFIEMRITLINHRSRQYYGVITRDVCVGKEVTDSNRVGTSGATMWENTLRTDWAGRIVEVAPEMQGCRRVLEEALK